MCDFLNAEDDDQFDRCQDTAGLWIEDQLQATFQCSLEAGHDVDGDEDWHVSLDEDGVELASWLPHTKFYLQMTEDDDEMAQR